MGVLDLPTHRILIRDIAESSIVHTDENANSDHEATANNASQRPRRQRTPKLVRKDYRSHDIKRGNGGRQRKRNENLFFLYSFVESLDINILEDDDYVDNQMTAFGELLTNPEKMQAWTEFMNLSEERQRNYLDDAQNCNSVARQGKADANKQAINVADCNPNFERITKKIQDYLRSDHLATESLESLEEDFVFSMTECSSAVILLNVPSSYERLLVYGLCQYMQLQANTHKFKRKCLMEIQAECCPFQPPSLLLSDYLKTFSE